MIADTAFAAWLLDSFVAFTALLMFVLAVRRPVAQWLGPQAAYMLWLLPAARWFVPPLMLPDALRPFAIHVQSDAMTSAAPSVAPLASASAAAASSADAAANQAPVAALDAAAAIPTSSFDLGASMLLFWGCTALFLFALLLIHHHRVVRSVHRGAHELGKVGHVRLVESPDARSPLAVGLWRGTVIIPQAARDWSLDAQQMAVAHEVTHHRAGHLYHNYAAMLLLCLNWFNPVAWIAARAFIFDQEADCDARTLRRYRFDRAAYAQMLVAATTGTLPSAAMVSPRANLVNKSVIVRRIGRIAMSEKTLTRRLLGYGLVLASGAALVPLTASFAQADSDRVVTQKSVEKTDRDGDHVVRISSSDTEPTFRRTIDHKGKTYKVYADTDLSDADIRKTLDDSDKAAADGARAARDAMRASADARAAATEAHRQANQAAWEAQDEARKATAEARREALSNAAEARREGLVRAQEARRDALEAAAEARRGAAEAAREAVQAAREARNIDWDQVRQATAEGSRAAASVNWGEVGRAVVRAERGANQVTVVTQSANRSDTE